jgi:hypothetical protein
MYDIYAIYKQLPGGNVSRPVKFFASEELAREDVRAQPDKADLLVIPVPVYQHKWELLGKTAEQIQTEALAKLTDVEKHLLHLTDFMKFKTRSTE